MANRIDAPLLATGAGSVGNILGNVAAAIPAVAIPGAATVPGAAAIGAAQGSLTPTSSGESVLKNAAIGGAAGAGGIYFGRGLNALYQGGRALVEPFTQAGRERIGGRVLQQFGVGADDVRGLSGAPTITGARPMMAEQIADPAAAAGAARLQGGLRAADPRASTAFAAREAENNAARVNTLRGLTGSDGGRDFAVANRAGTAGPMYQEAFAVDAGTAITPKMQREMQTLLRAPAIQQPTTALATTRPLTDSVLLRLAVQVATFGLNTRWVCRFAALVGTAGAAPRPRCAAMTVSATGWRWTFSATPPRHQRPRRPSISLPTQRAASSRTEGAPSSAPVKPTPSSSAP